MENDLRLRGRRNMYRLYQLAVLMELQKKLIQGITLKEYGNILGNTLIGFHADNKIRGSIPLSCVCVCVFSIELEPGDN